MTNRTAKRELFELDPEWQARVDKQIDADHIAVLVDVIKDGGDLPPISVVRLEDGALAIVDGYHRFAAYVDAGTRRLPFEIVGEGKASIPWHLAHANSRHGRSRDAASKRASVRYALAAPEGAEQPNTAIARWCGVSVDLVRSVREEVLGATSRKAVQQAAAELAAADDGTLREAAEEADVSKSAVHRAKKRAKNAANRVPVMGDPRQGQVESDAPMWQSWATDCAAIANAVVTLQRAHSSALDEIPGGQEIRELLRKVHAIATRRAPRACPNPACDPECAVCSGHGFVTYDPKNWQSIVDAAEDRRV